MTNIDPAAERCGCEGITRRSLLGGAVGLGALGLIGGLGGSLVSTQLAFADTGYTGDTLVVVSFRGGFDGLSAVVPANDAAYQAARPTIGIPDSQLLQLDSTFGLHPALSPLMPLWSSGDLAFVHAVGQLDPTQSHFEAMEEMERAAPGSSLRTGWIDRMVGLTGSGTSFAGTSLGPTQAPISMSGPAPIAAMQSLKSFSLSDTGSDTENQLWHDALTELQRGAPATVAEPALSTLAALSTARTVLATSYTPANGATYPTDDIGSSLQDLARLIKADVGIRVAAVDCGNWDMHVGLGDSASGWMHDNLTNVGKALAAFSTDLGAGMSNVCLVTMSEFGRRVMENGSGGVDHGHGNAVFLLGGGIKGTTVYGDWPGLASDDSYDDVLAGTTDYRTILAELLEKRCGISGSSVFPGLSSTRLGLATPAS